MIRLRDRHIRLAREDLYTTPIRKGVSDPLEYIQDKIWQYGIKIKHRKLGKSAQARHPVIYLGSNWDKKDDGTRAGLLAHEFCHCKHQNDVGLTKWLAQYGTDPRWRWSVEVMCYRESLRYYMAAGMTPARAREWCWERAGKMRSDYLLWRVSGRDVHRLTGQLLEEAV